MAEKFRVPRTTALFVEALARILREHLDLRITEHEHWEFERVAKWDRGEYCHAAEWSHECYKVLGAAKARNVSEREDSMGGRIEIRAVLIKNEWHVLYPPHNIHWDIQIWVKLPTGEILSGRFSCRHDGISASSQVCSDVRYREHFWDRCKEICAE